MAEDSKFPYFLLGLGVGFVAGVLIAPRSGEETIQYLKEKAGESKDFLHKRQEALKEQAQGVVDKGREALLKQKEQIAAAYDAGRQAYRDSVSPGSSTSQVVAGEGEAI